MAQINFVLWLQSFRSPLLDAFFTAVNATAEDNLINRSGSHHLLVR